jgi:LEA14-like dessication related protein
VYQDVRNFNFKSQGGLEKTTLSMEVRLYNPNSYDLKLKKSGIDVFLNNKPVGIINIEGGTVISKLDTSSIPVTLDVDLKKVFPNLLEAALNNTLAIKLSGIVKAGRHGIFVRIPIHYEGTQDILGGIIKM